MRRERRDNLEQLDRLEDEDDPATTDPKETPYVANTQTYVKIHFIHFLRTLVNLRFMVDIVDNISSLLGSSWFPWRSWSSW